MKTARYLRFAQALSLVTIPACGGAAEPTATEGEPASHAVATPGAMAPVRSAPATTAPPTVTPPRSTTAPHDEEGATQSASSDTGTATTEPAEVVPADAGDPADASAEMNIPHSSGPIVPPELPPSFAC